MRNTFFEYYILADEERIKKIWNDAIIVLDANVLLNLYRFSEEAKDNLLEVLEFYKDRLWIPYQVGWEYHQNRIFVYAEMNAAYDQIATALEKETAEFIKKLNLSKYSRHPKIDTQWFENQVKDFIKGLREQLLSMKDSCADFSVKDEINERVTGLFNGKVGNDFDISTLKELYKEGQTRYNEKIPPGYCDAKDKKDRGNRHLYGDLIWWKQVLKEAREKESNVILVTDDVKEDWYERLKGKTIGPRKELLQEFRIETQKDILIYPTPKFLEYAKENMSISVDQHTISEANEIQRENEAIRDVMLSISEDNEDRITKIFSENPWMSAESFLKSYLKPKEDSYVIATKFSGVLGEDNLISPLESISKLALDNSAILSKSTLNPFEGLSTNTKKISDIHGWDYLSSPLENISKLTLDNSAIFGKSALNPFEGLSTNTKKISDIHGWDYLGSPLENISKLTLDNSAIMGKSTMNPFEGLSTNTKKISDIHGWDYLSSPLENISKLTLDNSAILGKSACNSIAGAESLFSIIGKDYHITNSKRKNDKSTNK